MERAESSPGRGNSAVVFSLRAGCPDAEASRLLESYLCEHANKRFGEEGIELPYPTRTVMIRKEACSSP